LLGGAATPRWYQRAFLRQAEPSGQAPNSEQQPLSASSSVHSACRLLLVDDEPAIRTTLTVLFEDEGYLVEEAANGQEALERIERTRPALVLLDMRMPIMDGWQFAHEIQLRKIDVPIVVMTAARDARAWDGEIAAAAYVTKPFDLDFLLATVNRLCAGQKD